jgi:dissimilatory sulfite reductase (desulfoviridin) alpha/beta subunit
MNHFDIQEIASTYGIKNIRVFGEGTVTTNTFPYASVPDQMVEYRLVESKYSMKENYKLTLSPCKNKELCAQGIQNPEHLYITDFNTLVKDHIYRVYVLDSDGYTLLSPSCTVVPEGENLGVFSRVIGTIKSILKD